LELTLQGRGGRREEVSAAFIQTRIGVREAESERNSLGHPKGVPAESPLRKKKNARRNQFSKEEKE